MDIYFLYLPKSAIAHFGFNAETHMADYETVSDLMGKFDYLTAKYAEKASDALRTHCEAIFKNGFYPASTKAVKGVATAAVTKDHMARTAQYLPPELLNTDGRVTEESLNSLNFVMLRDKTVIFFKDDSYRPDALFPSILKHLLINSGYNDDVFKSILWKNTF